MSHFSEKHEAEGLALHTPEFERDIAETMAEREEEQRAWASVEVRRRAERRERIATALAPAVLGMLERDGVMVEFDNWREAVAIEATRIAEEFVVRLDAAEARDREATK